MSKKTLLEESTVRKFMKFANIGHLAESYLDEAEMYEEEEDEMLPPEAGMEGEMGMEPAEDEMGMEDEMAPEEGAMEMGEKEQMLADVVAAVADALGVEAEVEGAEMAADGEEESDFLPADVEVEDDMVDPEGAEMAPEEEEEEPMMEMVHEDDEEESVVAETVKRVTARLKEMNETAKSAKSREAMVESVVERIMSKINKK